MSMNFRDQFPILNDCVYLNTAYSGLLATDLANWRKQHDESFVALGSNFRIAHDTILKEVRNQLANLFGVKLNNCYLVQNFSVGFNTLLNGLERNHRFLLLKEDYPSVNYPIKSSGFKYAEVDIDADLENNILRHVEQFKPTAFAFSMVQYISGIRIDPEFIKKLKATYPNLLIIGDATQFMGTSVFDFDSSGFDAVLGSGYKWLLGGFGNGYAFLSDQLKEAIYNNRKHSELPNSPFLMGRDHLSLTFEPGHLDTLNFGTLNESLKFINRLGMANIEKAAKSITDKARLAFHQQGLVTDEMMERPVHSTIISLPLNEQQVTQLNEAKVVCSARGSGTRFSFHFYNDENDLDKLSQSITL